MHLGTTLGSWMTQFNHPLIWAFGGVVFFSVVVWSIAWKGLALWTAARRGEKVWFVALLVINTVGVLEILYLYVFSKKTKSVE